MYAARQTKPNQTTVKQTNFWREKRFHSNKSKLKENENNTVFPIRILLCFVMVA